MNLSKVGPFLRALRDPDAHQGDVAILKAEAFGVKAPEGIDERLDGVRGYLPPFDLDAMRALPDGTMGREVVRNLDDNGFKPFTVSEAVRPRVLDHTFLVRYLTTHDFIHVLTGFDTSHAGEIGVLALTVEQGFAPGGAIQEWSARLLYPLLSPSQWSAIRRNRILGHELGRRADFLLSPRYEDMLDEPVSAMRARLNVPDPHVSGVLPAAPTLLKAA